jgi:hypothetical protein
MSSAAFSPVIHEPDRHRLSCRTLNATENRAQCADWVMPVVSRANGTPNRNKIALTELADKVRELV